MRAKEFLNEQDSEPQVQQTQQAISSRVQTIFDLDELNQIYSYIRKIDIGTGFDDLFSKDQDLKQIQTTLSKAIVDVRASFEDKMGFAKELVNIGIIDVNQLLTPGITQSINDLIVTDYPNVYQGIASELMNIAGSFKSGAYKTHRGKGEFFLAVLSPEITLSKSGGGDLVIDRHAIEVKDNLARLRGRKGYGSVDQARQSVSQDVQKFIQREVRRNPNTPLQGKQFDVGIGSKQNFWTEFGPTAVRGGADVRTVVNFIRGCWGKIIKSLFINASGAQIASVSPFNNLGVLNFEALQAPMKALAFNYYKAEDGFEGILFLNSSNMTSTYIESAEDFVRLIGIKNYGFGTGGQNGMQVKTP